MPTWGWISSGAAVFTMYVLVLSMAGIARRADEADERAVFQRLHEERVLQDSFGR